MVSNRRYLEALRACDQHAVAEAKRDVDRRLNAMNELREQITRERNEYLRVAEYEQRHELLIDKLALLENWRANLAGRLAVAGSLGVLVIGTTSAFVAHLLG